MTVRVYLHSFSRCCIPNVRNRAKFEENSNLLQFKVIQGHRPWCLSKAHVRLPISHNSNFGRIFNRFRDIDAFNSKIACFLHPSLVWRPLAAERHEINIIYTPLKSTFNGLQFRRWHYRSIRLAAVAAQNHEIRRNSDKIDLTVVQGHPRSSILVSIESSYATF